MANTNEYELKCNCLVCSGEHDDEILEKVLPTISNNGMGDFNPHDWISSNSKAHKILHIWELLGFFSKLNNIHALFKIKELQSQKLATQ